MFTLAADPATGTLPFYWAGGVDPTYITHSRADRRTLEAYTLMQHDRLWRADFDRAAELGITALHWGLPWARVNPQPGRFDWAWADEVLDCLVNQKGLHPLVGLVDYGTPPWLENAFLNPDFPHYMADYTHAVAERYGKLVPAFVLLRSPSICADYAGRRGLWPPYRTGEHGYYAVLLALARGMVQSAAVLRAAAPTALLAQIAAPAWFWSDEFALQVPILRRLAQAYLAFDLCVGNVDTNHLLWPQMRSYGVTAADLEWLQARAATVDLFGVALNPQSGGELVQAEDGTFAVRGTLGGEHLAAVLRETWRRHRLPMMVMETNAAGDAAARARWMDDTLAAVRAVRAGGLPVVGYGWSPLLTTVDWGYPAGDAPLAGFLSHTGLWDAAPDADGVLQRHATDLVARYRDCIAAGL